MSGPNKLTRFVHRYMTPENRLAEVMCGLVMVLSFTTTTNAAFTDITPRQLLIAVLGCNTAWGIVDGVTYILGNLLLRSQANQALVRLQQADQPAEIKQSIDALIGEEIHDFIDPSQRPQLHAWIREGAIKVKPQPVKVTREDIYTAAACFIIVFLSTLPLAVPFMFMADKTLALRVSNFLALGMLFVMGYRWAKNVGANRWQIGIGMWLLGLVLVIITVVLGG